MKNLSGFLVPETLYGRMPNLSGCRHFSAPLYIERVRCWPRHTEAFESFNAKPSVLQAIRNNKDILCLRKLYNWAMHSANKANKEISTVPFIRKIRFPLEFSGGCFSTNFIFQFLTGRIFHCIWESWLISFLLYFPIIFNSMFVFTSERSRISHIICI